MSLQCTLETSEGVRSTRSSQEEEEEEFASIFWTSIFWTSILWISSFPTR